MYLRWLKKSVWEVLDGKAENGHLLLLVSLLLLAKTSLSFSGIPADLNGKVTTKQGGAGFDVILTLLNAQISDTTDTAGNYHMFKQGTAVSKKRMVTGVKFSNGVTKMLFFGNTVRKNNPKAVTVVTDLHGRSIKLDNDVNNCRNNISDGVYFFYDKSGNSKYSFNKQAQLFADVQDTISISYQGTFIKKIPVTEMNGVFNITLDTDLPARKHSMLVASYSNNAAYIVSADNKVEWEYKMPGSVQDAWILPNGNILLSGGSDVREVTREKQVVWKYTASAGEMHNCYPLPGNAVLFGENSSGKLYEIDRTTNTVLRTIQTPCKGDNHNRFRMVRKTADSTYLVTASGEGIVYELNKSGAVLRKISGDTLQKKYGISYSAIHSAVKLENGNIMIGCGYNSSFVELDKSGNVVWKLSASDIPEIGFNFAAAGQFLPGGTFLFAGYSSTYKFVEVTRAKKVIWKLQNSTIGNPTHVYVTDCWSSACDYRPSETLIR